MLDDATVNNFHPLAYVTSITDKDTMYLTGAMQEPDQEIFVKATEKDIADNTNQKH
jgi:hypothetical protein